MTTEHQIADRLESLVLTTLEDLVQRHLPGWRIPGTFGGHPVEPDVAADLAYTLAHLYDLGVTDVAGTTTTNAIASSLACMDGNRTHTFFSYRVAETLARFGRFDNNTLIDGWSEEMRHNLETAVDSTDWVPLLDEGLPRNYAAVLARCELARRDLGLPVEETLLTDLIRRTRAMLEHNPLHFLDDSTARVGRTDIYTVDVWHFTEPLAPLLGDLWIDGVDAATDLVERVGSPDGAAITWGRSTGALAVALTLEMAALALTDERLSGSPDRRNLWLCRADTAADAMRGWFAGGLTSAHQHRSTYAYRGPFRRMQMTLDLLGKLAWATGRLRSAGERAMTKEQAGSKQAVDGHPDRDELVSLDAGRATSVWTYQKGTLGFVVPFVGATTSDYVAAPRRPGLFEVPVDSSIACWVPIVAAHHRTWSSVGVPESLEHHPGGVSARWSGFEPLGDLDPPTEPTRLPGRATLFYEISERTVLLRMDLCFEEAPDAVGIVVPEVAGRPLHMEVTGSSTDGRPGTAHRSTVDTSGVAEWRSFTSELPLVHQVDLDVGGQLSLTVKVTPTLRVASTCHGHHYDRALYGPLEDDRLAVSKPNPLGPLTDPAADLDAIDLYHLHWPEWMAFDDFEEHRNVAVELADRGIPVVWTAHNLTPHDKRREVYDPIYQLWAERADAVIHHSAWGEQRMRERYRFAPEVRHTVIPHGHFGGLYPTAATPRDEAEAALGLPPAAIRIGILGAPRSERDVSGFLDAVADSSNLSVQACCWSSDPDGTSPEDPRIAVDEPYRMVDPATYGLRLAACDVMALPVHPDGEMLATGLAADVVGHAKAALVTEWPYLDEVLGDAGIAMGHSVGSMTAALDALTPEGVADASKAARALQPEQSWERAAALTAELFESVLRSRGC